MKQNEQEKTRSNQAELNECEYETTGKITNNN
jgi:hypothetical protein